MKITITLDRKGLSKIAIYLSILTFFVIYYFFGPQLGIIFAATPTPSPPVVGDSPDPQILGASVNFSCPTCAGGESDTIKLYICKDSLCSRCGRNETNATTPTYSGVTGSSQHDPANTTDHLNWGYLNMTISSASGNQNANWTWDFGASITGNFRVKWYAAIEGGWPYSAPNVNYSLMASNDGSTWTMIRSFILDGSADAVDNSYSSVYWDSATGTYRYIRANMMLPNGNSVNHSKMYVDWVRVYQEDTANCWCNSSAVSSDPGCTHTCVAGATNNYWSTICSSTDYNCSAISSQSTFTCNSYPSIGDVQCEINSTENWQSCTNALYGSTILRTKVNCTDNNGLSDIKNATYNLTNIPDNNITFNGTNATSNSGDWWIYDNPNILIQDSGTWNMTIACVDSLNQINRTNATWSVPWGHLETYLISPATATNVTQNEFFTFQAGVRCAGGECGSMNATLDPFQDYVENNKNIEIKNVNLDPKIIIAIFLISIWSFYFLSIRFNISLGTGNTKIGICLLSITFFVLFFFIFGQNNIIFAATPTPSPPVVTDSPDPQDVGNFVNFSCPTCAGGESDTIKLYICKDSLCSRCGRNETNATTPTYSGVTGSSQHDPANTTDHLNWGYLNMTVSNATENNNANWTWDFGASITGNFRVKWYAAIEGGWAGILSNMNYSLMASNDGSTWTMIRSFILDGSADAVDNSYSSVYWDSATGTYRYIRANMMLPNGNSVNDSKMYVDWVRVYQEDTANCWCNSSAVSSDTGCTYLCPPLGSNSYWSTICSSTDYNCSAISTVQSFTCGKGDISTTVGATPFYTTSDNPQFCTYLRKDDTCNKTWSVNATGESGTKWFFYVKFNMTNNSAYVTDNETTHVNLTIKTPTITVESPLNQTYSRSWVWSNMTIDSNTVSWCGVSLDKEANNTLTNSSGNWNYNLTGIPDYAAHNVTFYCNLTSTLWYTSTQFFSVSDLTPPKYFNVGQNKTSDINYWEGLLFYTNWTDAGGLDSYIFGWNQSGEWVNVTEGAFEVCS